MSEITKNITGLEHTKFFSNIVVHELFKAPTDLQIAGMTAILDEWNLRDLTDVRWLAYILGTAYWETGRTMQPIEEKGKGAGRPYGKKIKYSRKPYETPDKIYYGRGHTQNTWYEVYEKLTAEAKKSGHDWDFLNHPELLLQMKPSIWATFHSMINGVYTGVGLKKYFNEEREDWINSRKIINSLDKAEEIAEISKKFYLCLSA